MLSLSLDSTILYSKFMKDINKLTFLSHKSKRSFIAFIIVFALVVTGFFSLTAKQTNAANAFPNPITEQVSAADGWYPYPNMPCEHSPYATSGKSTYNPTVPWCTNYDWGTKPFTSESDSSLLSPYGYGYRNCTDYVAWKVSTLGVQPAQYKGLGNGKNWASPPSVNKLTVNGTPAVGSQPSTLAAPMVMLLLLRKSILMVRLMYLSLIKMQMETMALDMVLQLHLVSQNSYTLSLMSRKPNPQRLTTLS